MFIHAGKHMARLNFSLIFPRVSSHFMLVLSPSFSHWAFALIHSWLLLWGFSSTFVSSHFQFIHQYVFARGTLRSSSSSSVRDSAVISLFWFVLSLYRVVWVRCVLHRRRFLYTDIYRGGQVNFARRRKRRETRDCTLSHLGVIFFLVCADVPVRNLNSFVTWLGYQKALTRRECVGSDLICYGFVGNWNQKWWCVVWWSRGNWRSQSWK